MPQHQGQLRHLLPFLAQLQQRRLARVHIHQLRNVLQHPLVLVVHDAAILRCRRRVRWARGMLLAAAAAATTACSAIGIVRRVQSAASIRVLLLLLLLVLSSGLVSGVVVLGRVMVMRIWMPVGVLLLLLLRILLVGIDVLG